MRFLAAERRAAMFAIYAFCRAVDDVVDEPGTDAAKAAGLDFWRREIELIHGGAPEGAIGRELAQARRRFDLERADFTAVIDGMAMDAGAPIRAPSMVELDLYCDRVACAVGRLSVRAFGAPVAAGLRLAAAQGRALQLTNILRDLAEDAAIGRLYLPRELLTAHGIMASDPDAVLTHPALGRVCRDMASLAHGHFAAAAAAMAECPRPSVRPARVMLEVYRRTLTALEARGWSKPAEAIAIAKPVKLWIALRHGLL
ncbi:MAG: squalene synthase HpnD [Alphaproteobacteria bacterium]|nr:squalene synthase HpnD [Alphaproteobacteria bacterium]